MANKTNILQRSKENKTESLGESHEKGEGINLNELPVIIKRCLLDWETSMRLKLNKPYLDCYEEIFALTGIAPQTLRKYTNTQKPEFPPINKLFLICLTINDCTPLEYLNDYTKSFFEIIK